MRSNRFGIGPPDNLVIPSGKQYSDPSRFLRKCSVCRLPMPMRGGKYRNHVFTCRACASGDKLRAV